jgi:copper resistance protein C
MARVFLAPELILPIHRLLRRLLLPGALVFCVGAIGIGSVAAQAHAILLASVPSDGGRVKAGAAVLQFRFNSRIDHDRSRLTLIRPDHSESRMTIDSGTNDEVLESHATLAPGAVIVRWQVLAVDGHITRGDVAFTVSPATGP